MSMADDDLEQAQDTIRISKKSWYEQGYATGSANRDFFILDTLRIQTRQLFLIKQRVRNELTLYQEVKAYTKETQNEMKEWWKNHLDFGFTILAQNEPYLSRQDQDTLREFAENYFSNQAEFLRLFDERPADYLAVMGLCRKDLPSAIVAEVVRQEFREPETLAELKKIVLQIVRDRKAYQPYLSPGEWSKRVAGNPDKYECFCRGCSECCGSACGCRFIHESDYECDEYDSDPDECQDNDHYYCDNCDNTCACSNH